MIVGLAVVLRDNEQATLFTLSPPHKMASAGKVDVTDAQGNRLLINP